MSLPKPNVKSDPLDVLLFAIGLRLSQLAKMGDDSFKKLLENREFTIQLGSETEEVYRYYHVNHGKFSQSEGKAENPALTILFKDSMTGVKLLTKGDATAFMIGIQNGDLKMSGDFSLLMWFNQIAKHIVPKIPEQFKPVIEKAKPFIEKATPLAKDLCEKAMDLFSSFSQNVSKCTAHEKQTFHDVKDVVTDKLDKAKTEVHQVVEKIEDKLHHKEADKSTQTDSVKVEEQPIDTAEKQQPTNIEEKPETKDEKLAVMQDDKVEIVEQVKETSTEAVEKTETKLAENVDTNKSENSDVSTFKATNDDKSK